MSLPSLSLALREATWRLHQEVEATPLVQSMLQGTIPYVTFVRYTGHLLPVYEALEDGLRANPTTAPLLLPGLARTPLLRADLSALGGEPLDSPLAARVRHVAATFPLGLVAYFYLRYLGDLSGGPMLRQALRRLLPTPDSLGLSFYDFSALGPLGPVKQTLRESLDHLTLTAADRSHILEEAVRGFQEHHRLFSALP